MGIRIKDESSDSLLRDSDELSESTLRNSDDEQLVFKSPELAKARSIGLFLVPLFAGVIISSLFWSVALWQSGRSSIGSSIESSQILHCGNTPDEARALGCEFQMWDFSWTPEPCCDRVAEKEYLDARDWGYYVLGKEGKTEVDIDFARSGQHVVWSTLRAHYLHCAYSVRRFARNMAVGGLDSALTDPDVAPGAPHVMHCLKSMTSRALNKDDALDWDAVVDKMIPYYRQCYVKLSKEGGGVGRVAS